MLPKRVIFAANASNTSGAGHLRRLIEIAKALPKTNTPQIDSSPDDSKKRSPMSTNKKSYTVTCIKGKLVKKIIAPKPNCPTGWKKK